MRRPVAREARGKSDGPERVALTDRARAHHESDVREPCSLSHGEESRDEGDER